MLTGNNWIVECPANHKYWQRNAQVRVKHELTGKYLHHTNHPDVRANGAFIEHIRNLHSMCTAKLL